MGLRLCSWHAAQARRVRPLRWCACWLSNGCTTLRAPAPWSRGLLSRPRTRMVMSKQSARCALLDSMQNMLHTLHLVHSYHDATMHALAACTPRCTSYRERVVWQACDCHDHAVQKLGEPLLHAAARIFHPPEKTVEQCAELIRLLQALPQHPASLCQTCNGSSCLEQAVNSGNGAMVTALLQGCNSNREHVLALVRHTNEGLTALHYCALHGHISMAKQACISALS